MTDQTTYKNLLSLADINVNNLTFDTVVTQETIKQTLSLTILRLDKIHEDVSGNKLFKLYYFIEDCLKSGHNTLITFGGAYSNHLVATAYLCNQQGIKSIGIVRGEKPERLSHTLNRCLDFGMELKFVSREEYSEFEGDEKNMESLKKIYGAFTLVPEGGYSARGAKGATLIMDIIKDQNYTHVCTAVGTATTLAGLLIRKENNQEVIAIPVIKNMHDIPLRLNYLGVAATNEPVIFGDYHFGGYVKHTMELIDFMNSFYAETRIPTDFVYTAKMMYGINEQINSGYFKDGSKIVCIHTGGLQGNKSLPAGTLIF